MGELMDRVMKYVNEGMTKMDAMEQACKDFPEEKPEKPKSKKKVIKKEDD